MQKKPTNKLNRYPRRSVTPEKKYEISEYINNEPMIKRLFADHHELTENLEKLKEIDEARGTEIKVKEAEIKVKEKELAISELKLKTAEKKIKYLESQSIPDAIITLVVALLFGFGVNIASTPAFNWAGWMMIIAGIFLTLSDFLRKALKGE